jgi:hypothetical protein
MNDPDIRGVLIVLAIIVVMFAAGLVIHYAR